MSGGGDSHPNTVKDVRENKIALRSELWIECDKGKKYSFLSPISDTSKRVRTGEALPIVEWIGSLYAWFRLHIS